MAFPNISVKNLAYFIPPLSLPNGPLGPCWIVRSGPNMHSGQTIHVTYDKYHALQTIARLVYADPPQGYNEIEEFLERGGNELVCGETNQHMGVRWRYMTVRGEERCLWFVLQNWRMEPLLMRGTAGVMGLSLGAGQSAGGGQSTVLQQGGAVLQQPPVSLALGQAGPSSTTGSNTGTGQQQDNQQAVPVNAQGKIKDENEYDRIARGLSNAFADSDSPKTDSKQQETSSATTNVKTSPAPAQPTFKPTPTSSTNGTAASALTNNTTQSNMPFGQPRSAQPIASNNVPTASTTGFQQTSIPAFGNGGFGSNPAKSSSGSGKQVSFANPAGIQQPTFGSSGSNTFGQPAQNTFGQPGTTSTLGSTNGHADQPNMFSSNSSSNTAAQTSTVSSSFGGTSTFSFGGQSSSGNLPFTAEGRPKKTPKGPKKPTGFS